MFKLLVVEDDRNINNTIGDYLEKNGFEVKICGSIAEAYNALYDGIFDLIVCDITAVDNNGFELVKNIRNQSSDIPVIFISDKSDIETKRKAFMSGADDYITKPYIPEELTLRVNALLRRSKIAESKIIRIGDLTLNADERSVLYKDEFITLTTREFNIIYKMLSNPKKTFSRTQLMNEFWSADSKSGTRTVDVYMTKLRDKFARCREFEILTVHGVGYKAVVK